MILTGPAPLHTAHVAALCNKLVPGAEPMVVASDPQHGVPANDCFALVDSFVEREGGVRVIGWALWEMPSTLIEAEFHAVWRRPTDGALVDLNPRDLHFSHIHFLPDVSRSYEGRQVDNVRQALCMDPKVKQFIHLKGRMFSLLNSGDLANQHGQIALPPRLAKEYNALVKQINALIPGLQKLARIGQQ